MVPQTPAEGIMKVNDWGSSKLYKIDCQCTHQDHSAYLEVTADDFGVHTDFWVNTTLPHCEGNIFQRLVKRISLTAKIWTGQAVKYDSQILLSEQQAVNLAAVLRAAASEVVTFRELQKMKTPKI